MNHIPFSQVINNTKVDLRREYDRLYGMFFLQNFSSNKKTKTTLRDYISMSFKDLPFRGTCVSLDDFDDFYGYHFEVNPATINVDKLIKLCEYSYNLVSCSRSVGNFALNIIDSLNWSQPVQFYLKQVLKVVEAIGYMANRNGILTDFVPKDQAAISVAEIVDPELSYKVIEYNHHSMKGDLSRKREILLALADKLEPQGDKLKQINASLKSDIFFMFNRVNIRHNNSDPAGSYYREYVSKMTDEVLEQWYDETYQMCLLAFLELDNTERKKKVEQLKKDVDGE